ncbi:MAG TPA: acyltransferase family protein [Vicinamibacterales bacterium]
MTRAGPAYRPDIDGLRALAVIAVLVFHAFPASLPGGFTGVDVFFVISGYLISGIILSGIAAGGFTYGDFYARRIRRIFPALIVVLAAAMAAGWFLLYADDYARLGHHASSAAAFAANFAFWREASYFDVAADLKPLLHLWSLGVEEQFYLAWPIVLAAATRWRRGPLITTLAIGAASFLIAIWTVRIDRTAAFYAPWNRFWELLAGATLACIQADAAMNAVMARVSSRPAVAHTAAVIGIASIVAGAWLIDEHRVFPGLWALLPVVGTALLIAAGPQAIVNRTLLSNPIVVWIGLISYPLYLWHWPLLSFAQIAAGGVPSTELRMALLAVSVVLSAITFYAVEQPIRFGVHRHMFVTALPLAMAVVFVTTYGVRLSGGFIDRPINRGDAARLVDYYVRMRQDGIENAYRRECDFMEWDTEATRDSIDPSCTQPGRAGTVLLWGDSFAQALSLGLRESLPDGVALAQVATSLCRAEIVKFDTPVTLPRCERANASAIDAITRLRPDIVVVAQSERHLVTDWRSLTDTILQLGARHVIVVGPNPRWLPSLPRVYASNHMEDRAEYVREGIDSSVFEIDRVIARRLKDRPNVTFVSLVDQLCSDGACLARVPGEDALDLMVMDFGHLTPKGSSYVGKAIWKPYLDRVLPKRD